MQVFRPKRNKRREFQNLFICFSLRKLFFYNKDEQKGEQNASKMTRYIVFYNAAAFSYKFSLQYI